MLNKRARHGSPPTKTGTGSGTHAGLPRFCPPDREIKSRLDRAHVALRSAGFDGLLGFSAFLAKDGHVCYLTNHKITNAPWSFNARNNGFGFAAVLLPAGVAWMGFLSSMNAWLQLFLPTWVRARGISVYLMVLFESQALGALLWGAVAAPAGLSRPSAPFARAQRRAGSGAQ